MLQYKAKAWLFCSFDFWLKGVEASVEGVLGGYGCVNDTDVKGSEAFLKALLPLRFGKEKRHLVALGEASITDIVCINLIYYKSNHTITSQFTLN